MFRQQKHVFTCPDVIHLRNQRKKYNRIAIATNVLGVGALWVWAAWDEKKNGAKRQAEFEEALKE